MIDIQIKKLILGLLTLILITACSTTRKNTQSLRAAVEQLLISEALMESLSPEQEVLLPLPQGTKIYIETTGVSSDQHVVRKAIAKWFGQHGYLIQGEKDDATHLVNVIVESIGTEYADKFFGIPPIRGAFVPIATPELALYKAQYQTGYVKLHSDIFELSSGRFVSSTQPFLAEKYHNDYTVLFLFTFVKTDLMAPPQLGTLGRKDRNYNND